MGGGGGHKSNMNNLSGLQQTNSRRNISLSGGTAFGAQPGGGGVGGAYGSSNLLTGGSRPKTAAMPGLTGVPRPPTAAMHNFAKRGNTNMSGPGAAYGFNFVG